MKHFTILRDIRHFHNTQKSFDKKILTVFKKCIYKWYFICAFNPTLFTYR